MSEINDNDDNDDDDDDDDDDGYYRSVIGSHIASADLYPLLVTLNDL